MWFRAPDACVWMMIVAILGAFLKHDFSEIKVVSTNLLNVLVVVYFFQGLAIVSYVFEALKVSPLWRGIWYLLILVQLFLMVSLVGFVDFWLEFRERLSRKSTQENKGF
jgi:uncharacterized protein YybS (DUF2232 family)